MGMDAGDKVHIAVSKDIEVQIRKEWSVAAHPLLAMRRARKKRHAMKRSASSRYVYTLGSLDARHVSQCRSKIAP